MTEKCIKHCVKRFETFNDNAKFFQNDGQALPMIPDNSIDFVFSFDSLIHIDEQTLFGYLNEIMRVLMKNGIAFIHHSNEGERKNKGIRVVGFRPPDVTTQKVKRHIEDLGGSVLLQEILFVAENNPLDCITVFSKSQNNIYRKIDNDEYGATMYTIRKSVYPYFLL
jgi:ubiquinone/menaquinone biosynthesis C-methylase UbiE